MIRYLIFLYSCCVLPTASFVVPFTHTPAGRLSGYHFIDKSHDRSMGGAKIELVPEVNAALICATAGGFAMFWFSSAEDRAKKAQYAEWEKINQDKMEERRKLAYIEPRQKPWTDDELKAFDGTQDPDGPILVAAAGKVYNVWKGRHFYGPGGEYSIFAGRDATRLLAKFRTEEEDEESLKKPLTMGERATLEGYIWTFKEKYEVVGTMEGFDPKDTAMW